jgi:hypothetical protein
MTTTILLTIILFLAGLYFYIKHNYIVQESTYEGMENNNNNNNIKTNSRGCPDILVQEGSKFYLYNSKVIKVPGVNPVVFNNLEDYIEFIEWQRSQNINCPVLFLQQTLDAQGNSVYKIRPSPTNLQGGLPPNTATSNITTNPASASTQTFNSTNTTAVNFNNGITGNSGYSKPNNYLGFPLTSISSVPTVGDIPAISIDGIPLPSLPNPTLLIDATQSDRPYNINSYPAYDESPFYIGRTTPLDMMDYSQESQKVSPNAMDPNWGGPSYTQQLVNDGYYNANQVKIYVGDGGN